MLLSMTGHGEGHTQAAGLNVTVEIRTINGRFLKTTYKCPEGYAALETEMEGMLRERLRRGSVQINVRVSRTHSPDDFQLNLVALQSYRRQLDSLCGQWHLADPVRVESLLALPGVVEDVSQRQHDAQAEWPAVREAFAAALARLDQMRADEGRVMAADMRANAQVMVRELEEMGRRAPLVIEGFRQKLEERVRKALEQYAVKLDPGDLVREVSLFADRSDISEEIVRLGSHLRQFEEFLEAAESSGRKLEFLSQEMLREANTIGSKANDVEIARHVIEIKTAIEKIREMVQNVE